MELHCVGESNCELFRSEAIREVGGAIGRVTVVPRAHWRDFCMMEVNDPFSNDGGEPTTGARIGIGSSTEVRGREVITMDLEGGRQSLVSMGSMDTSTMCAPSASGVLTCGDSGNMSSPSERELAGEGVSRTPFRTASSFFLILPRFFSNLDVSMDVALRRAAFPGFASGFNIHQDDFPVPSF